MSSGKTETLGLNQWQLSDAFLMEEMNADNRKVDASIRDVAGSVAYRKLMDVTTMVDATQVDLDVSGIDLTKYAMVQIFANMLTTAGSDSYYVDMRINNTGGYWSQSGYNANNSLQTYVGRFRRQSNIIMTGRAEISGFQTHPASTHETLCKALFIRTMGASYSEIASCYCAKNMGYTDTVSTINFVADNSSYQLKAGSRFVMYGVRL